MIKSIKIHYIVIIILSLNTKIKTIQNIYAVEDIKNITFIQQFPEYEDTEPYGVFPHCLDESYLSILNPTIDWNNPTSFTIKNPKKIYVAMLRNAQVASYLLGTIFHNDCQLLFNISWAPHQNIFFPGNTTQNHKKFKQLATVQGFTLFYHSIIDRFPSILLLRDTVLKNPNIKLLINNTSIPQYLFEYFDLLGISKNQLELAGSNQTYLAHELYFATPFLMEPIPRNLLKQLRNELVSAAQKRTISKTYNHNLIVIIQRREPDRQISNINELIHMIKTHITNNTYEIIVFDASTSVAEQIQIFNHAKVVIGCMASGLTNIIYANPGTIVIDIRPYFEAKKTYTKGTSNGGREWCWWLASAFDLNYWPLPHDFTLSSRYVTCPIESIKKILQKSGVI